MRSFTHSPATIIAVLAMALVACKPKYSDYPPPYTRTAHGQTAAARPAPAKGGKPTSAPKSEPPKPEPPKPQHLDPFAQQFIDAHNEVRAKHCAGPLTWSKKLADIAQNWANTLKSKGCVFGHSPGAQYGENLAAGTVGALDPTSTVAMWYDEIKLYKFPNGGFSARTGHFTQVVWRSTQQVGCGHVECNGNDIYVCTYDPAGNWEGQYRQEVLPASCKK
ncbi:MAG TPA: CAP domain-containing protein [Kofleriaceae bacterium]|nr:CAP domain-containing protein [Kofleriaceae bacterium]